MNSKQYNFDDVASGRQTPPPAAQTLGWRFLSVDRDEGVLRCSFEARPEFLNPAGVVQGGFLTAMLDEAMGPVASALSGEAIFTQTLEIKISFLSPAPLGTIIGEARIVKKGRSIAFLEGRLIDKNGELLAMATATCRLLPMPAGGPKT